MPVDLDQQFDHFLDALRQEQVAFLDSMRTLCMPLGSCSGSLAAAASSQARLTQQFLDAQRSLLRRTAEYDTAALDIERSAAEDARQMVIGAANYALDCGVPSDTLEALRWSALDAAVPVDESAAADAGEVARRQQQELSRLLDSWWAEAQERGTTIVERANSFAGVVRSRADARVSQILEAVARQTAPLSGEAPTDISDLMPLDLLAALETADSGDLGGLLDSLLLSLGAPDEAAPLLAAPSDLAGPTVSAEITALLDSLGGTGLAPDPAPFEPEPVGAPVNGIDGALIQLGQRATELSSPLVSPSATVPAAPVVFDDEPAGLLAVFTRVVLPMLLAVGAAVALLAWMG